MFTKEEIENYKKVLEDGRARVEKEIEKAEKVVDFGNDAGDTDQEADEAEEMGNELSIAAVLREQRDAIEVALRKIDGGVYGPCENCGKEIEKQVLAIAPESRLCAECKKKQE